MMQPLYPAPVELQSAAANAGELADLLEPPATGSPGMSDDELMAFCEAEEADALDYNDAWLAADRAENLAFYFGQPFDTDSQLEENRSKVISTDVFDGVEGVLPNILKPFVSSDDTVRFDPEGPDDEDLADQETQYVNYVFHRKNPGFAVLQTWIKDGLLSKVGVVKYWWDETDDVKIERLSGITDDQMLLIAGDADVAVTEHTARQEPVTLPDGTQQTFTVHDCVLRRVRRVGQARVANVPPEEFLISRDATAVNPKKARFCEHRRYMTLSELREAGFDVPDDLQSYDDGSLESARDLIVRRADDGGVNAGSPVVDRVLVREMYPLVDRDGDGIAERRCVVMVGRTLLQDVEVEEVPFSAWTPILVPHRHTGVALADVLRDFQKIKSLLLRATLENVWNLNNNRTAIGNRVNVRDMLTNQVGGIVRVDAEQIGNDIVPLPSQPIGEITMGVAQYIDAAKENRTGYTRYNAGLDANSLNKTATGVTKIMEAANARLELIARNFAEIGLCDLMVSLHGLLRRHQTQQETVKLTGRWVTVSPREWRSRTNMSISVGLGTGDKQQTVANLLQLLPIMRESLSAGLTTKDRIFNALAKLTQAMGEKNVEQFWQRPQPGQPDPPPQIPPEVQAAQEQGKALVAVEQIKQQGRHQEVQIKAAADAQQANVDAQNELTIERYKVDKQMELAQFKAQLDAQTAITIKQMELEAAAQREAMRPAPVVPPFQGVAP